MDTLSEQQRAILDVERRFWRTAGAKDAAIAELGLTPVRYYQLLNQLADHPAALAADPVTMNRVDRLRRRARRR